MSAVKRGKEKQKNFFKKAVVWWHFFWNAEAALEEKVEELRVEIKREYEYFREDFEDNQEELARIEQAMAPDEVYHTQV